MNAIQYGFHRLYLRYSSDEEYQIEAIARIVGREKDALDKLAVELALAESSISLLNHLQELQRPRRNDHLTAVHRNQARPNMIRRE